LRFYAAGRRESRELRGSKGTVEAVAPSKIFSRISIIRRYIVAYIKRSVLMAIAFVLLYGCDETAKQINPEQTAGQTGSNIDSNIVDNSASQNDQQAYTAGQPTNPRQEGGPNGSNIDSDVVDSSGFQNDQQVYDGGQLIDSPHPDDAGLKPDATIPIDASDAGGPQTVTPPNKDSRPCSSEAVGAIIVPQSIYPLVPAGFTSIYSRPYPDSFQSIGTIPDGSLLKTDYSYDYDQRLIGEETRMSPGPSILIDELEGSANYTYDGAGRIARIEIVGFPGRTGEFTSIFTFEYDLQGNLAVEKEEHRSTYMYAARSTTTITHSYDEQGFLISSRVVFDRSGAGLQDHSDKTYTYDEQGKVVAIWNNSTNSSESTQTGRVYSYVYDENGNLLTMTIAYEAPNTSKFEAQFYFTYDSDDNLLAVHQEWVSSDGEPGVGDIKYSHACWE
jgi:hypothetical protein